MRRFKAKHFEPIHGTISGIMNPIALIKRGASHRKFYLVMDCEASDQTIRKFSQGFENCDAFRSCARNFAMLKY